MQDENKCLTCVRLSFIVTLMNTIYMLINCTMLIVSATGLMLSIVAGVHPLLTATFAAALTITTLAITSTPNAR